MSELFTIIPAAGRSQRYVSEGYLTPKPFLRVLAPNGIEDSMVGHVAHTVPYGDMIIGFPSDVLSPPSLSNVPYFTVRRISHSVGQADTVLQLLDGLHPDCPILVLDCDMVLRGQDINALIRAMHVADVAMAVTKTFDPNASRVDQVPNPTSFAEKRPISEWGIVGARIFKSAVTLEAALRKTIQLCANVGAEPYLSMALNHYPGLKYAHVVNEFWDWGTPDRLRESGAQIV